VSAKTIKDLPERSRPREKLMENGAAALTDEELVAAILGMGAAGVDVQTIARQSSGFAFSTTSSSCEKAITVFRKLEKSCRHAAANVADKTA
jgi:hypothetical protein